MRRRAVRSTAARADIGGGVRLGRRSCPQTRRGDVSTTVRTPRRIVGRPRVRNYARVVSKFSSKRMAFPHALHSDRRVSHTHSTELSTACGKNRRTCVRHSLPARSDTSTVGRARLDAPRGDAHRPPLAGRDAGVSQNPAASTRPRAPAAHAAQRPPSRGVTHPGSGQNRPLGAEKSRPKRQNPPRTASTPASPRAGAKRLSPRAPSGTGSEPRGVSPCSPRAPQPVRRCACGRRTSR